MMAERGISLAHTTIMRWIARYVPEFEKRWNRFACGVGRSWRVDETYVKIKGSGHIFTVLSTSKERRWIFSSAPSGMSSRQSVSGGVQEPGPAATKDHARRLSGLYGALEVKRCIFYVWLLCLVVAAACCARWSQDGTLLRLSEGNSPNRRGSSRHMLYSADP